MGMLPVQIDEHTEVHVKDNAYATGGWHLWMSLYRDGKFAASLNDLPDDWDNVVPDIDDETLIAAAHRFAEAVTA